LRFVRSPRRAAAAVIASILLVPLAPAGAAPEDIRIIRDKFGVPHVFAPTSAGAAYGSGYALAQDRLWQMHVLRRLAKGRLSEILGPIVVELDKEVRFWTYTEEERASRFATYPADIKKDLQAFADGINAWMAQVRTNPALVPHEFIKYQEQDALAEDWTVDDSVALQDALVLSFGSGGGNELVYAALLDQLIEKFGKRKGRAAFNDLVLTSDPDTIVTIPRSYRYKRKPTAARIKEAQSHRRLTTDARLSLDTSRAAQRARSRDAAKGTMDQLRLIPDVETALDRYLEHQDGLRMLAKLGAAIRFGSNASLVGPKLSKVANTLQTGGPQVGYYVPQILADFGIHGGDVDATGMTFAGAGPAVLIGRGDGYAWTTTTGASDLTDTYVEKLNPDNNRQYRFNGKWEDMDCRTETYRAKDAPFDQQEICRTHHGPVLGFDEENDVAYSLRYAWFNREGQTVEGFWRYNSVKSLEDFATSANYLSSNHNMFYSDDQGNWGFWHPGNHVRRAKGVDMRLPQDGTGGSEWRGLVPIQKVPHEVNSKRDWLVNWNNQPAFGWRRERAHPALDNAIDLQKAVNPKGPALRDPYTGKPWNTDDTFDFGDMSGNLRYAAFKHHTHTYFKRFLPKKRALKGKLARKTRAVVGSYNGFRVATGETPWAMDGTYHAGFTIIERWVKNMLPLAFEKHLNDINVMDPLGNEWAGPTFTSQSLLWHILNRRDRLDLRFDWLGKSTPKALAAKAFEETAKQLAAEYESDDPAQWTEPVHVQQYQRLNNEIFEHTAECEIRDCSGDSGRPGDVEMHIAMDRGTYNHIIEYLSAPRGTGLGNSRLRHGSVIPPGQNGFLPPTGAPEPEHYEDQLELYVQWKYKPMPLTLEEALAVKESEETITRETP